MSSGSSLLRRALVPLLAAAAAIPFCAPARAATATLTYDARQGSSIYEIVDCIIDAGSTWKEADFHAQELSPTVASQVTVDNQLTDSGPGDYNAGANVSNQSFGAGSYNLWVICSGYGYNYSTWNVSTG
ncbi:MAG: hypothetical protein M3Y13_01685, partial [Armatimonadota bacterium]|nr:hypothetical protein [Armatimonadota bacterium]